MGLRGALYIYYNYHKEPQNSTSNDIKAPMSNGTCEKKQEPAVWTVMHGLVLPVLPAIRVQEPL